MLPPPLLLPTRSPSGRPGDIGDDNEDDDVDDDHYDDDVEGNSVTVRETW